MKPKAALVKAGKKPAGYDGRGRMSAADKALVEQVAAENPTWNIEGFSVSKATSEKPASVTRVKVTTGKVISDIPDQTRGLDLIPMVEGKPWVMGIKGVCDTCHNSLTYCWCPAPKVRVDGDRVVVVTFKPAPQRKA